MADEKFHDDVDPDYEFLPADFLQKVSYVEFPSKVWCGIICITISCVHIGCVFFDLLHRHFSRGGVLDFSSGCTGACLFEKKNIYSIILMVHVDIFQRAIVYSYGVDTYFSAPGMAEKMLDHILHFPPGETLMFVSGKGDSKKVLRSVHFF